MAVWYCPARGARPPLGPLWGSSDGAGGCEWGQADGRGHRGPGRAGEPWCCLPVSRNLGTGHQPRPQPGEARSLFLL